MVPRSIGILGINTEVGKTVVSAALCALFAPNVSYWKPIQTGNQPDSHIIEQLLSPKKVCILQTIYSFSIPRSPHIACQYENQIISFENLTFPQVQTSWLIIESAGGALTPVNNYMTFLDLFALWKIPVLLVVKPYLGALHHTLATIRAIETYPIPFLGIISSGDSENYPEVIELLQQSLPVPYLGHCPPLPSFQFHTLKVVSKKWEEKLLSRYDILTSQ